MDKDTKYAENQRKASRAYYNRQKQIKLDKKTAELLHTLLYDTELSEMEKLWPETLKLIKEVQGES